MDRVQLLVGGTPLPRLQRCLNFITKDFQASEATSHLNLYAWLKGIFVPNGWFRRMPSVSCQLTTEGHLEPSLEGSGEIGYGFAYRILDAQYFGVPQKQRRVFVIGCLGSWRGCRPSSF